MLKNNYSPFLIQRKMKCQVLQIRHESSLSISQNNSLFSWVFQRIIHCPHISKRFFPFLYKYLRGVFQKKGPMCCEKLQIIIGDLRMRSFFSKRDCHHFAVVSSFCSISYWQVCETVWFQKCQTALTSYISNYYQHEEYVY